MSDHSFPKAVRLQNTYDYKKALRESKKDRRNGLMVYHCRNSFEFARLGMIIPKKIIKKAVERNRVKRVIRESFRANQRKLREYDIVIKMLERKSLKIIPHILNGIWEKLAK